MDIALKLALLASTLVPYGVGVGERIATLPPRPDQSTIQCRDGSWEQANLQRVAGMRLHTKLAPVVEKLLADAKTAGLTFGITSAYRTCSEQTLLRQQACGAGQYNLTQRPMSECRPPTEPAGRSLHQEGLALDFSCPGSGTFKNSACYRWLKTHATTYYLHEHALEPWHWSTTGR